MKILKYLVVALSLAIVSCQTEREPVIIRAQACSADCDSDDDGNCCESDACRAQFCHQNEAIAYLRVGPGRICGVIQGCLPPVDIRDLLIQVFTANPQEAYYVFEAVKSGEVFAKSTFQKFDEKSGIATFSNEVVNEQVIGEEMVLSILTSYLDDNGKTQSLKMKSDVFPEGFFYGKK